MPKISDRGRQMPSSPIRKLVPFAEQAKKKGVEVLHLNIGQPDISSPRQVLTAIQEFNEPYIPYTHSLGLDSLRKGIQEYYKSYQIHIDKSHISICVGASEALEFVFQSCFNEGDELLIPEPFYANYMGFARGSNINIVPIHSRIDNGFALPPIEDFAKRITKNTKGILICNPGNPTGYLYSQKELETLRDICIKNDLFLIADEVYREFCYDGQKHHSILSLPGLDDLAIVIDSFSKRYSLCGIRLGMVITRNTEVSETILKYAQARLSPPTLAQIAAEAALKTKSSYFNQVIEEYQQRRDLLVDGLNEIPGVICPKPSGAFYCIAELPVENAEDFCKWILAEYDWGGKTVMMAPAAGFYASKNVGKNQVRIAYVLQKSDLKDAIQCLKGGLETYKSVKESNKSTV